jgi:hypothetical protein
MKIASEAKRLERRKQSGEIFTPSSLAEEMVAKLAEYGPELFANPKKTIIDPACGNGQLLIPVLKRKLKYTNPVQAISTIYGCDIFEDNVNECRLRLIKVIFTTRKIMSMKAYINIIKYLFKNFVCVPLDKYPNGSLDYLGLPSSDTFNENLSQEKCLAIIKHIEKNKLLERVTIP